MKCFYYNNNTCVFVNEIRCASFGNKRANFPGIYGLFDCQANPICNFTVFGNSKVMSKSEEPLLYSEFVEISNNLEFEFPAQLVVYSIEGRLLFEKQIINAQDFNSADFEAIPNGSLFTFLNASRKITFYK